ncbi:MAG: SdiA-regulated domain-containing protein [Sulfurimonas sp.]|nr:SdiA-regulated domain-containing protein [Sulfurimonas sp.]
MVRFGKKYKRADMKIQKILSTLFLTLYAPFLDAKSFATIPEASGICFVQKTQELIVVNDEGWIYRLSLKGEIVEKKYLGEYDLEGVAYDAQTNRLLLAEEARNSILIVDIESLALIKEVRINPFYKDTKILETSKNDGIEDIAINNGTIYLSKQSYDASSTFVFSIDTLEHTEAKITQIFKHGYIDIAGLCFDGGFLYMTSDKKNLLIKYDLANNKTIQEIKLPKSSQEGICFDERDNLYIADDKGKILRYKRKKLGL